MNATSVAAINKQVVNLWNTFYNDPKYQDKRIFKNALMPKQYPENLHLKAPILFIGLNPSFSNEREIHWQKLPREILGERTRESNLGKDEVFKWPNKDVPHSSEIISRMEEVALGIADPAYMSEGFRPFSRIASEIAKSHEENRNWIHVDLFFWHGTSQQEVKKVLEYNQTVNHVDSSGEATERAEWLNSVEVSLNEFGDEQLKLSFGLIGLCEPRIVLVANAIAARIVCHYLKDEKFMKCGLKFDPMHFEDNGYDYLVMGKRQVPIFFSAMLHGGATDQESLWRLKWHMKRALNDAV